MRTFPLRPSARVGIRRITMDMQRMMRQAQKMQKQLADAQDRLADIEVSASAGGGMG